MSLAEHFLEHLDGFLDILGIDVQMRDGAKEGLAEAHDEHAFLLQGLDGLFGATACFGDVEDDDVRLDLGWVDPDPGQLGQGEGQLLRVRMIFGQPVIKGRRIPVSLIFDYLADGYTVKDSLDQFPHLTPADITEALHYGSGVFQR